MKLKVSVIVGIAVISIMCIAFFITGGTNLIEIYQTNSINLKMEKINEVKLMEKSQPIIKKYNFQSPYIQKEIKDGWIGYDFETDSTTNVYIRTDLQDRILIFDFNKKDFRTNKGIGIGSRFKEIEKEYGKDYYNFLDDQGRNVIGYIDRKNKIRLEFYISKNKVYEISLDKINKKKIMILNSWANGSNSHHEIK